MKQSNNGTFLLIHSACCHALGLTTEFVYWKKPNRLNKFSRKCEKIMQKHFFFFSDKSVFKLQILCKENISYFKAGFWRPMVFFGNLSLAHVNTMVLYGVFFFLVAHL